MRLFLSACVSIFVCMAFAADTKNIFEIQEFPGQVKVLVDIDVKSRHLVDYLFVVDDSGSMERHQKNLADAVEALVQTIGSQSQVVDFHAGVVSTGPYENASALGTLRGTPKYLDRNSPNLLDTLRANLVVGTRGSGYESIFDPIYQALTPPLVDTVNAGFYRPQADLAIIAVTDAEDQSQTLPDAKVFASGVLSLKGGDSSKVSFDAFLVPSIGADPACERDQPTVLPLKIEEAVGLLGGKITNLCSPGSFKESFEEIGKRITDKIGDGELGSNISRIPLPNEPSVKTITVEYGSMVLVGGDLKKGWIFDSVTNEVVLGSEVEWIPQAQGTKLIVTYTPADWLL